MTHLHPASLILLGFALLVAASMRDGMLLFLACLALMLTALISARRHFGLILLRSRWLLLTMLVLFGWMTPGTPLVGIPGATQEGLLLAAENICRLLIAISIVALMLTALPSVALVAGLRSLMTPLVPFGISRDRLAVRLVLTLQEVEASRAGTGSETDAGASLLSLPAAGYGPRDFVLGTVAVTLLLTTWLV